MTEEQLHISLCKYIDIKYPKVEFSSDMAGVPLSKTQAKLAAKLRKHKGYPDLGLHEPRGKYHGFYLELKKAGVYVYLKGGGFTTDKHINEQRERIEALRAKGYYAEFGIGFKDCQNQIDEYMKLPQNY